VVMTETQRRGDVSRKVKPLRNEIVRALLDPIVSNNSYNFGD